MRQGRNTVLLFGLSLVLAGCDTTYYPPVYPRPVPQADTMHYGSPSAQPTPAPAAEGMHYGPPSVPAPVYPSVTVTNSPSQADSMHYGN